MESKADVIGTTYVSDNKLVTRSALATTQVSVDIVVNANSSLTGGTEHEVIIGMVPKFSIIHKYQVL
jgi:hypothetical protein